LHKHNADGRGRLDDERIDTHQLLGSEHYVYDRLVTEMLEHAPEQTPDILVGLAYQYPCHHELSSTAPAGSRVETGMKRV